MVNIDGGRRRDIGIGEDIVLGVHQRIPKIITAWRIAGVFFAVGIFGPVLLMAMDRDLPYEVADIEIVPPVVEQGTDMTVMLMIRRNRAGNCGYALVSREIKDPASGRLFLFDPVRVKTPTNIVDREFTIKVTLPAYMPPIPLSYRSKSCYFCNPLQNVLQWPVCVVTPTAPFEITAHPQ